MNDGGRRTLLGQAVGRDFIGTFPASLNLAVAMAYRLFGVNGRAIGITASLLTAILCLLGMRVANLLRSKEQKGAVGDHRLPPDRLLTGAILRITALLTHIAGTRSSSLSAAPA